MVLGIKIKRESSVDTRLVKVFGALGDATRFRLVMLLDTSDQICVSEIANKVGITTAGASQHLKILEQAGLVTRNRMGQKICYEINKDAKENRRILELVLRNK